MKMVSVSELPAKRNAKKKLQLFIEDFVSSDNEIVKIEFAPHEYSSEQACAASFYKAINRSGYCGIKVHVRNGGVYLRKVK